MTIVKYKTCKKCGWIYPAYIPGLKCKICGEPFETVTCRRCKEQIPKDELIGGAPLCRKCHNAEEAEHMVVYMAAQNAEYVKRLDAWLARIAMLPKNYPTLTEEQWLAACRYFNGCALCGSDEIDTRGFFIPFELGGRYCEWNVVPLCSKCAINVKDNPNPFKIATVRDNKNKSTKWRECLDKTIEYLGGILNERTL